MMKENREFEDSNNSNNDHNCNYNKNNNNFNYKNQSSNQSHDQSNNNDEYYPNNDFKNIVPKLLQLNNFNNLETKLTQLEINKIVEDEFQKNRMVEINNEDKKILIIPSQLENHFEALYHKLVIFMCKELPYIIERNLDYGFINSDFKNTLYVIMNEINNFDNSTNPFKVVMKNKYIEVFPEYFEIVIHCKVVTLYNNMFKICYEVEFRTHLNRLHNIVQVVFDNIDFKYYSRVKFFRKHSLNSELFFDKNNKSNNYLIKKGNLNSITNVLGNQLVSLEIDKSDKIVEEIRTECNKIFYKDSKPNIVDQTKMIKKSKGFVFLNSYKNPQEYKCSTCRNLTEEPIQRIYFEEKNHKLCKINLCTKCFNYLTNFKDNWQLCFICNKFLINFGKLSQVKGGKKKKQWTETEINLLES